MKILLAARSIFFNIISPLSWFFCFERSETNCLDCFYMYLSVDHPQLTVVSKVLMLQHILQFYLRFSADFAPFLLLQKLRSWCGLYAFHQELVHHRLCLTLKTVSKQCNPFSDKPWTVSRFPYWWRERFWERQSGHASPCLRKLAEYPKETNQNSGVHWYIHEALMLKISKTLETRLGQQNLITIG